MKLIKDKCKICAHDPTEHILDGIETNLYKSRKKDVKLAKEYCAEQELFYSNHKLKPIWRKCCGILDSYVVTLKDPKKVS